MTKEKKPTDVQKAVVRKLQSKSAEGNKLAGKMLKNVEKDIKKGKS